LQSNPFYKTFIPFPHKGKEKNDNFDKKTDIFSGVLVCEGKSPHNLTSPLSFLRKASLLLKGREPLSEKRGEDSLSLWERVGVRGKRGTYYIFVL
jgi:hypothetical protein